MIKLLILVSLGGSLGAPARYLLNITINNYFQYSFPLGTLMANVIGSFFIGLFAAMLKNSLLLNEVITKYFLMIGFLGSFTTFSSFSLEVMNMFNLNNYFYASLYIFLSLILNIFAVYLGYNLLKLF